jgi:nucleoside-diphosphate-sugar epimerase
MRVFLTGATGFIGGRIAEKLVERGDEVVALVRSPEKAGPLREMGVEIAEGDITDRESMRAPMAGADAVMHVAAWFEIGSRDPREVAERINVEGTRNVLDLMLELGIPRGVYTSTLAVNSDTGGRVVDECYRYDGPHLTLYDETKWLAHHEVALPMMESGLPLMILQPGMVYGPGDHSGVQVAFLDWLRGRLPAIPRTTAFCWSHVDDVADVHIAALERGTPGESYIVAGPCHTMVEAFQIAGEIVGRRPPPIRIPARVQRGMARLSAVLDRVLPIPRNYRAETLRTSAGTTYLGDNDKARRELGYDPRPLRQGLAETLPAWMAEAGIAD